MAKFFRIARSRSLGHESRGWPPAQLSSTDFTDFRNPQGSFARANISIHNVSRAKWV